MISIFIKRKIHIKYLPFLIKIFFISIASTVFPPSGYAMTISFVPIICIIFWTLLLGKYVGIMQCFFVGIFTDLLLGAPLGCHLLLFGILRFLSIKIKERFNINSFLKNISAAYSLILIFFILKILFFIIYYSKFVMSEFLVLNILATLFLYPALAVVFHWLYKNTSIEKFYAKA